MSTSADPIALLVGTTPARHRVSSTPTISTALPRSHVDASLKKEAEEAITRGIPLENIIGSYLGQRMRYNATAEVVEKCFKDQRFLAAQQAFKDNPNNDKHFADYINCILTIAKDGRQNLRCHAFGQTNRALYNAHAKRRPDAPITDVGVATADLCPQVIKVPVELKSKPPPKNAREDSSTPSTDRQGEDTVPAKRGPPEDAVNATAKRSRTPRGMRPNEVQLASYAIECLSDGRARQFVYGLLLVGPMLQVHLYTREKVIISQDVDAVHNMQEFVDILLALDESSLEQLGLGTLEPRPDSEGFYTPAGTWEIVGDVDVPFSRDSVYVDSRCIFSKRYSLHGTGTTVLPCKVPGIPVEHCLKISFPLQARTAEADFVKKGREKGIAGLPHIFATMRKQLEHFPDLSDTRFPQRELRLTIVEFHPPIPENLSLEELESVLTSAFKCVDDQQSQGILLRDLSKSNIRMKKHPQGLPTGVIIDWDFAGYMHPETRAPIDGVFWIGTPLSMAIQLLEFDHKTKKNTDIAGHWGWHDDESKFWVLLDFLATGGLVQLLDIEGTDDWPTIAGKKRKFLQRLGNNDDFAIQRAYMPLWVKWVYPIAFYLRELYRVADHLQSVKQSAKLFERWQRRVRHIDPTPGGELLRIQGGLEKDWSTARSAFVAKVRQVLAYAPR